MTKETGDVVDDIRSIVAAHGRLSVDIATLGNDEDLFHKGMTSTASVGVMFALQAHFGLNFLTACFVEALSNQCQQFRPQ